MVFWASVPNQHVTIEQSLSPSMMGLPPEGSEAQQVSIPGRKIMLEWPSAMRIGDQEEIKLRFLPDTENAGQGVPVNFRDAYLKYNIMAEGRYEVAGMQVSPANPTRESMPAGEPIKFTWKITSTEMGAFDGKVWLSLRYLPLDGSAPIKVPIYAREITIRTSGLFGLGKSAAFLLAGLGIVAGAALVYDDIIGGFSSYMKKNWYGKKMVESE
ncbi:MAG: hypothetical protein C3F13_14435 [Anaerolineales bacterium]|nr:hypothetical protein [Anaerolineae bacterium]PWB51625.1 MAG: hypothetical protein C3F13_14435 [Anaerolineales bacterium]